MANNENINKVIYGNQTLIDLTNDSVTPQTLLEGETAHDRSGAQITGSAVVNTVIEENDSFALVPTSEGNALARKIYGMSVQDGTPTPSSPVDIESASADFKCVGKNLISYPYQEGNITRNGVDWIDNGDGTLTASGTATPNDSNHYMDLAVGYRKIYPAGTYKLTGGISNSQFLRLRNYNDPNNVTTIASDYGNGVEFTLQEPTMIGVYASILKNTVVTTPITFKPMIRLSSVADATYEPYKHTDIYTDNYGSNLIVTPFYNTTKTSGGITYTDNNDGTITVSGIASADSFFGIRSRTEYGTASAVMLQNKEYRVTGCPKGGSPGKYNIIVARGDTSSSKGDFGMDVGDGFNFVDNDASSYALTLNIIVKSGTVFSSPVVFKPEVREVAREPLRSIEVTSSDPYNLVKDGHYYIADTIDWDEVDGYTLTKRIVEYQFDGTENWHIDEAGTSRQRFSIVKIQPALFYGISDRFIYKGGNNAFGYFRLGGANGNTIVIQDIGHQFSSLEDFKTWVQSNNFKIVYPVYTPTKTSLTSAQAKALLSMRTYDESTSIDAINSPAPVVELEYAKNRTSGRALTGHNEGKIDKCNNGNAIGYEETVGTACKNPNGYTVGSYFKGIEGNFYKVTAAISSGDTITVGTNCGQTDIATELSELNADMTLDYTQSSLPSNTDINTFLQMVLERLYPDHIWDGIANDYGQTKTADIFTYTTDGNTATFVRNAGTSDSVRLFFDTPVATTGTFHMKGTISGSVGVNNYFSVRKSPSKSSSGEISFMKRTTTGTFEITGTVEQGMYIQLGTTYDSPGVSVGTYTVTITEFYVD